MGARILVADDEPHVRHVLALKFRQAGYEVLLASDGREALEAAREHRPALLVCDLEMPELTGLELCRALAQDPTTAGIPAVLLTAKDFEISREQTQGTAIRLVTGKPFSPRHLLTQVGSLLRAAEQANPPTDPGANRRQP
jgi:CheY-like chemotaxis protein